MTDLLTSPIGIVLTVGVVVGLALLVRGLRGRRVGDTPYCRKCSYNLTGLTTEVCPECGATAAPDTVVIGTRVQQRPSLAVGLVFLSISVAGWAIIGYGQAKNVNWYSYYPKFVLFQKARTDDRLAIDELRSRFKDGRLQPAAAQDVITLALDKHGAEPAPPRLQAWCDLIAQVYAVGGLNEAQQDRYLSQLVIVEMQVRPKIRIGDTEVTRYPFRCRGSQLLPLAVKYSMHSDFPPSGRWAHRRSWHDLLADGVGETSLTSYWPSSFSSWPRDLMFEDRPLEGGTQTLARTFIIAAFDEGADPEVDEPIWQRELEVSAGTEFVAADGPDPIAMVEDPSLGETLKHTLTLRSAYRQPSRQGGREFYHWSLVLADPAGLDLAFEVIAVADGVEYRVGSASWSKGTDRWPDHPLHLRNQPRIPPEVEEVEVILRTSREVASRTLDCFEVWKGELNLGRVRLEAPNWFRQSSSDD